MSQCYVSSILYRLPRPESVEEQLRGFGASWLCGLALRENPRESVP